jgi:hypothetical protein
MFCFIDVGARKDPNPRNLPQMDAKQATPVPTTLNPLRAAPPAPLPKAAPAAEGAEKGAEHH